MPEILCRTLHTMCAASLSPLFWLKFKIQAHFRMMLVPGPLKKKVIDLIDLIAIRCVDRDQLDRLSSRSEVIAISLIVWIDDQL